MACKHEKLVEGYYGHDCAACGELVYPYGSEPWMPDDDDYGLVDYYGDSDYPDWGDDFDCGWVGAVGMCMDAGTETCEFDCPFRAELRREGFAQ